MYPFFDSREEKRVKELKEGERRILEAQSRSNNSRELGVVYPELPFQPRLTFLRDARRREDTSLCGGPQCVHPRGLGAGRSSLGSLAMETPAHPSCRGSFGAKSGILNPWKILGLVTGTQTPPNVSPRQGQGTELSCFLIGSSSARALAHPSPQGWHLASREQCVLGERGRWGPRPQSRLGEAVGGPPAV